MGKKPEGFVVYGKTLQSALLLSDEGAGRVLKAAARLFLTGEAHEGLELSEEIVLSLFAGDIDNALSRHAEVCARNQRIAAKRNAPVVTTRDQSSPVVTTRDQSSPVVPNRIEQNREEPNREELKREELKEQAAKPPRAARFTPPTVDDVTAYCRERGNEIDPQRFVDFYAAKGWKIGKEAMKDWKAAVRTWERGDTRRPTPPPADLSWRKSGKDDVPGEVIEWPPGSGSYRLRQEVNADG